MIELQTVEVPVHMIDNGEKRLDASFYAQDVVNARVLIDKLIRKGTEIGEVNTLANDLYHRPRFKRKYVSKKQGLPFLTPTDLFMFPLRPRKSVIDPPEGLTVEPEWILITCSGTVGRCIISTSMISECILSHDIIRLLPKYIERLGYLYAYLNTWIGQAFLTKDKYGATVKHIEPHHISAIPIPFIPEIEEEISQNIMDVHKLRTAAQTDLLKAEGMIYFDLGLPNIDEEDIEYFGGEKGRIVKSFALKASDLELRLDASYHPPLAQKAVSFLKKSTRGKVERLGDITNSFVPPRFTRPYVKKADEGIPLLQGSHIPLIKPLGIKSIWRKMKNIEAYIVKKNWILVTASGTIGRLSFVSDYWDNWTATNHLLRIIADESKINPGYLAAFLQTVYGQSQLLRLSYGGVVDEIGEAGDLFNNILILKPKDENIENRIGSMVTEAYNKRDKANLIEDNTVRDLENKLEEMAITSLSSGGI